MSEVEVEEQEQPEVEVDPGYVINERSVPPAEMLEGVFADKLSSLNESLRMLTMSKRLGVSFSDNLAATYHIFRSELSLLEVIRKHNEAVFSSKHKWVVRLMKELEDELLLDDVFLEKGIAHPAGYTTKGRVSGESDPRAIKMVRLLIEAMQAWHFLLHEETSRKERALVWKLWKGRRLSGSNEAKVLAFMLDKRANAVGNRPTR